METIFHIGIGVFIGVVIVFTCLALVHKPSEEPTPIPIDPTWYIVGDVLLYRGQAYYRACDEMLTLLGGVQTRCVKRTGHWPRTHHETYDGTEVEERMH